MIDPILTPLWSFRGSILPKNDKIVFFRAHFIEVIAGEKGLGFNAFLCTKLKIFQKVHITEKQIFILDIFHCDFQISEKKLGEILVRLMFGCLVTYLTSWGHFR